MKHLINRFIPNDHEFVNKKFDLNNFSRLRIEYMPIKTIMLYNHYMNFSNSCIFRSRVTILNLKLNILI